MEIELHFLSPLASVAAWPAGTEPQAGLLVVLVIDMEQLVGTAFAG